jgi:hypothetical protein
MPGRSKQYRHIQLVNTEMYEVKKQTFNLYIFRSRFFQLLRVGGG